MDEHDVFQESIRAGILPSADSLEVHSVLGRFAFAPGVRGGSGGAAGADAVFPTFHGAACRDPTTGVLDHFLLVGLHTHFDGRAQYRPPLRAVFVIDVSGSMGQYYDARRSTQTRLELAKDTALHVCRVHLRAGDEVAVVACNEQASVLLPMSPASDPSTLAAVEASLHKVSAVGRSNLKAGVTAAYSELRPQAPPLPCCAAPAAVADADPDPPAAPLARVFVLSDFGANDGERDRHALPPVPGVIVGDRPPPSAPAADDAATETGTDDDDDDGGDGYAAAARPRRRRRRFGVVDTVRAMSESPAPVYTTFLCTATQPLVRSTVAEAGGVVGCNAVSVTPGEEARAHFDAGFESMVTPVARSVSLELHASPFAAAERCCRGGGRRRPAAWRRARAGAGGDGGDDVRGAGGDGEFHRASSVFPAPPGGAGRSRGGVALFKLRRPGLPDGQSTLPDLATTVAARVDAAGGGQRTAHYTLDIPCVAPRECGRPPPGFKDQFQTQDIRKAVALWYYTEFSHNLLHTYRLSSGWQKNVLAFKEYFEAAAAEVGDADMAKEVALWGQLVEIKEEDLKRNKTSCCNVM